MNAGQYEGLISKLDEILGRMPVPVRVAAPKPVLAAPADRGGPLGADGQRGASHALTRLLDVLEGWIEGCPKAGTGALRLPDPGGGPGSPLAALTEKGRSTMRYEIAGTVGGWTFYEVTDHGFGEELTDRPIYGYADAVPDGTAAGKPKIQEFYPSLDHAMVAAVGEKYAGPRRASGSGVGTAADWFMRMIGADQLMPAGDEGSHALASALVENGASADRWVVRRIETALRKAGYTVACNAARELSRRAR